MENVVDLEFRREIFQYRLTELEKTLTVSLYEVLGDENSLHLPCYLQPEICDKIKGIYFDIYEVEPVIAL